MVANDSRKGRSWLPLCIAGGCIGLVGTEATPEGWLSFVVIGHGIGLMVYSVIIALNNLCDRRSSMQVHESAPTRHDTPVIS
jgi:hypothetical protein